MKNHDAIPVPAIEIFARPLGKFQWTCPNCSQEFPLRDIDWRMAEAKCQRCQNRFRLGLGFSTFELPYALTCGKWNGYSGNRIDPKGSFSEGRISGTIEWRCPTCRVQQETFLKDKTLSCANCNLTLFVSLLIYRASKTFKVRCPIDWVFPKYVETPNNPIPFKTPSPSAGTPSSRSGGVS